MESIDLCIPIYLNQQVVFDLLAVLEDGFSRLSTLKTSTSESDTQKSGLGASIGVSNVFALLGVSFSAERGKEKGTQEQSEITQEKVHTPTSLFAKLRLKLREQNLLRSVKTQEEIGKLASGEFVEFKALLRKNPLVDTIEGFKQMMEIALLFTSGSNTSTTLKQIKGSKQPKVRNQDPNTIIMQQMDGMLTALTQGNSIEIIGELLDISGVKSVLTARLDFFSEGNATEIIDGEFRVLGKVVRVVMPDSGESINLLRKTTLGRFGRKTLDQLSEGFDNSELEEAGINFPKLITEIEGPALQVIPIAIFT